MRTTSGYRKSARRIVRFRNAIELSYALAFGLAAERAGRHFSKTILVGTGEFAEMPEPPVHGHIGDSCGVSIGFAQLIPSPMQPESMQVRQW